MPFSVARFGQNLSLKLGRARLRSKAKVDSFEERIHRDWNSMHYNRAAFVNAAVQRVLSEKGDCSYLEIGCSTNSCFDTVPLINKEGVDPARGGTIRTTSDEFFQENSTPFDVVFVDGLHEYRQCQRDALHALNIVPAGGFVLFHDFMPTDWKSEYVPRLQTAWSGDVWKVAFELAMTGGVRFVLADADHGVGIAFKEREPVDYKDMSQELADKRFRYFFENYSTLPILPADRALEFIRGCRLSSPR